MKKLSVIVPVYNEQSTLNDILDRIKTIDLSDLGFEIDLIVVDDASSDGSWNILQDRKSDFSSLIRHEKNMGKGAAIRTALNKAEGEYIIVQDADLEYDPEEYRKLLEPVVKRKAEVVFGSRFTGERRNMFLHHWIGNRFLTALTNLLYCTTLSDMETCYKLFSKKALSGIEIRSNRFNFEPEITAKILKKGIRIYEVPISYAGREYSEGKKITWRDGFSALWAILKFRFID
ncbi:glycosyltransferase family 2 protein [bacterium]|nr:glycosyltransferase family 2 protein [candidate division CSSED10-310 bacterium]